MNACPEESFAFWPNQDIESKKDDKQKNNATQAHLLELSEERAKRGSKQGIPMRDAVEHTYGVEIRIDSLTTPFNEIKEPVLLSVMQFSLNIPRSNHICFDVPLVRSL